MLGVIFDRYLLALQRIVQRVAEELAQVRHRQYALCSLGHRLPASIPPAYMESLLIWNAPCSTRFTATPGDFRDALR
jgi:hypothetical protein